MAEASDERAGWDYSAGAWQPIATAPRGADKRPILAWDGELMAVCSHFEDDTFWIRPEPYEDNDFKPTHWMPLPAPPDAPASPVRDAR